MQTNFHNAAKASTYSYSKYDLVYDELDGRLHRFHSYDHGDVILMDRNSLTVLPDTRHWSQVMPADLYFRDVYVLSLD